MPLLLVLIPQILGYVLTLLKIVNEIRGLAETTVKEHLPFAIEKMTSNAVTTLIHPTWGNHAILDAVSALGTGGATGADIVAARSDILNALGTTESNILAALGTPSQAATAPSWWIAPSTPPTPPTDVQNAAAVWAFYPRSGASAGEIVSALWSENLNHATFMAVPLQGNPLFSIEGPWYLDLPSSMDLHIPNPDWADIQTDETILAWLQRTDTANVWIADPDTGAPLAHVGQYNPTGYAWKMRPLFESFPPRPGQAPSPLPTTDILTAPVWPGSALVTMGTPVALVDQLVVDEVMDGLLINVTTPPGKLGSYRLGGVTLDYGAGRIAFESDDGQLEMWQYLGFRDAIYTPKTMAHASKARLQVLGGAEGTVTPWTVS